MKGYEGQKVQDVKKPIQQKMIDSVSVETFTSSFCYSVRKLKCRPSVLQTNCSVHVYKFKQMYIVYVFCAFRLTCGFANTIMEEKSLY